MKLRTWILMVAAFICVYLFPGIAVAQEFSADMISRGTEGNMQGKIYAAKDKMRMEMGGVVTITRMDKNVAWVLMPEQKMCMEQPMDPKRVVPTSEKFSGELERTLLGRESLEGRDADKYHVTYESAGKKETVFQWIDVSTKIPLKTEAEDGSWSVEYRNLKAESQPESLFEVPSDYNKMNTGFSAMAAMASTEAQ